jgi:hypothetical protein
MLGLVVHSLTGTSPLRPGRTLAPTRPGSLSRSGSRPFGIDRNICNFLWYGVVAGEGLRSVGADGELPNQERVLYPAPRSPFIEPEPESPGLSRSSRVDQGPHQLPLLAPDGMTFSILFTRIRYQYLSSSQF